MHIVNASNSVSLFLSFQMGDILRSPFVKFMNYISSYTTFLVILFTVTDLETFETGNLFGNNEGIANIIIIFYILGTPSPLNNFIKIYL